MIIKKSNGCLLMDYIFIETSKKCFYASISVKQELASLVKATG